MQKRFEQLRSSEQGLTGAEASKRLDTYGPNDTTGLKRTSPVVQFLRLFLNPLVAILLVASVLRDGTWLELPRREVVPGDIVRLVAGDLVPGDARLVRATDLHVQQAALTGESLPVEKSADDGGDATESFTDAHNCVFLGTSVVSGIRHWPDHLVSHC